MRVYCPAPARHGTCAGEPLLAPGAAPPPGESDDTDDGALAAAVAALEHGALELLLEFLAGWAACGNLQQRDAGRLCLPLTAAQAGSPLLPTVAFGHTLRPPFHRPHPLPGPQF
jgi:hypothetical protein